MQQVLPVAPTWVVCGGSEKSIPRSTELPVAALPQPETSAQREKAKKGPHRVLYGQLAMRLVRSGVPQPVARS